MSLQFNGSSSDWGIIQHIEDELGFNPGDISGNSARMAKFTSDVNLSLDEVAVIEAEVGGLWQQDDINHTKYPIIRANLKANQQDYTFTEDEQGNLVTDIYKVMAKFDASESYKTLEQADLGTLGSENDSFMSPVSGASKRYDLIANGVFLENLPVSDVTQGLLIFNAREGSYFTTSDTTKKPGYDARFHYFSVHYCVEKYTRIKGIDSHDKHATAKALMRRDMVNTLRGKNKAVRRGMLPNNESTR